MGWLEVYESEGDERLEKEKGDRGEREWRRANWMRRGAG